MKNFCGLVSIVGRPNVGKSTLLNRLIEQKISITSRKSQTTRNNILGIKTKENHQMVFIDTPGVHINASKVMNKVLNQSALCLLYTSPSPRDKRQSRMPSSA